MLSQLAFLFITFLATTEIKVQYSKELTDSSMKSFTINIESCFDDPNIKLLKEYINDLKTEVGKYYRKIDGLIWRNYFSTSRNKKQTKTFSYSFDFIFTSEAFNHYETSKKFSKFAEHPVIIFTVNGKLITRHTVPLLRLLFFVSKLKKDDWAVLETLQELQEKYEDELKKYEERIYHPGSDGTLKNGCFTYDDRKYISEERLKIVNLLTKSLQNAKEKKLESNLEIAKAVLQVFVKDEISNEIYVSFNEENIQELFNCDEEVTHSFKDYDFEFLHEEILFEEDYNLLKFFY